MMRKITVMLVAILAVLTAQSAFAAPFVDSLKVETKTLDAGSHATITVSAANDSAVNGMALPFEIKTLVNNAFGIVNTGKINGGVTACGAIDSITFPATGRLGNPSVLNSRSINVASRNNQNLPADSILIGLLNLGGSNLPPGSMGVLLEIHVCNNSNVGTYQIDSTLVLTSRVAFTHPPAQASKPTFSKGLITLVPVGVRTEYETQLPTRFELRQNQPNPFNPNTKITFALPRDTEVKLEIFNALGQKVRTLVDEHLTAGVRSVEWNSTDDKGLPVPSGIYFYKIRAQDFTETKKMVLLK